MDRKLYYVMVIISFILILALIGIVIMAQKNWAKKVESLENQIELLKDQVEKFKTEKSKLEQRIIEQEEEIKNLKQENENKNKEIQTLNEEIERYKKENQELKQKISQTVENVSISQQAKEPEKMIKVDLSDQRLQLLENNKVVRTYIISSGGPGMETPTGNFKILSKEENHWSATYGFYMPYSLRFYMGYFIHEVPYRPDGTREGEDSLGTPSSHGCIRVGIGESKQVYDFAKIGMPIVIQQ